VVVEFEIATGDDPVSMPTWACPSCRAAHQIGVIGRVRSVVSTYSPMDLPPTDGQ